jgi:DNA-directed RNA polymerase specialized sigma24 family protein
MASTPPTDPDETERLLRNAARRSGGSAQLVRAASGAIPDHEILVMRYLEDLSFTEIAAILEIGESAAKMRHLRAIKSMRLFLKDDDSG